MICVPFWRESSLPPGVWFGSERGRKLAIWTVVVGAVATLAVILLDNVLLHAETATIADTVMTRGLVPTILVAVLLAGLYVLLVRKLEYTHAEAVMAGLLLLVVALTVCTVIGVWFRGAEMHLVWPWARTGMSG